jgi:hypothetical protein
MDGWLTVSVALIALAIVVRACGARGRFIERVYLLTLAITICASTHFAISDANLNAAEEAAASGQVIQPTLATWMDTHYEVVLLPVYIVVLAVLIDLMARGLRAAMRKREVVLARRVLPVSASANAVLFVVAPAFLYFAAVNFTQSPSIVNDAGAQVVRPFVAAYGAPAYALSSCFGACKPSLSTSSVRPWPWNLYYSSSGRIVMTDWVRDAGPWLALSLLLACAAAFGPSAQQPKTFAAHFNRLEDAGRTPSLFTSFATATWRGRMLLILAIVMGGALVVSIGAVYLVAYFSYLLLWAAGGFLFLLAWIVVARLRKKG